jgi:hypothetical protein
LDWLVLIFFFTWLGRCLPICIDAGGFGRSSTCSLALMMMLMTAMPEMNGEKGGEGLAGWLAFC